jgi:membrane fusion protein, multidrug efflux system
MKGSRITAVGLVAAAAAWIASGYLLPRDSADSKAAIEPGQTKIEAPFRVAVANVDVVMHRPKLTLSGQTEADRRVMLVSRANGILTALNVRRGQKVEKGEVIAVLSDEAREAQVVQAEALFEQRRAEYEAKKRLIEKGIAPQLNLVSLESQLKAAQAALAAAKAERDRGVVRAPWAGVITDVPAEIGGASFSVAGHNVAQLMALDPMLAVVEVSEQNLGGVAVGAPARVRLITGRTVDGKIRYVAKSANAKTRTYRVEVAMANADGAIPDGITAEVTIDLAPVGAARVPRSALTFSSAGDLGVRVVDNDNKVAFMPVKLVDDEQSDMWVKGLRNNARVIVKGQDFVREGQRVVAVRADTKFNAKTAER